MSDIIAGTSVGICQIIIGHPIDTIKVLIQNRQQWTKMSLKSYYRGCTYPFIGSIIYNMLAFPIYERTIDKTNSDFASGFLGGLLISPFIYAVDIGKIKNQTGLKFNCNDIFYNKGFFSSLLRESIATGIYFSSYNFCKKELNFSILLSGGIAGLANWTLTYPIDVIRTRQIAQNISIRKSINQGYLWKGYTPCAIRAILVNSISFYVYEIVKKQCDKF